MKTLCLVVALVPTAANALGAFDVLALSPWQFRTLALVGIGAWLGYLLPLLWGRA